MQRQRNPIFLAVVMALLMSLALVGTAGAAGGATSEDSAGTTTSGKSSAATETTHPHELPTTGTGGELQQQTPVDLHGFALIGLAFGGLALLAGGLAVRKTKTAS
jgi:hypothetical protein